MAAVGRVVKNGKETGKREIIHKSIQKHGKSHNIKQKIRNKTNIKRIV